MRHLISAFAVLMLSACGSSSDTSTTAPAAPAKTYKLGEAASAEGLEVTLTSVKQTKSPVPGIEPAGPDETYLVAKYTLRNTGTQALNLMSRPGVELRDAAGTSYALDEVATPVVGIMGDAAGASSDMNPGTSAKAAAVWKVAKKGFDLATWKIVVQTDPTLEFALK